MPPKPRAPRKPSMSAKGALADKEQDASAAMPPPPDPPLILEPEMNALSGCLKNSMVKTGQVYQFYNDTRGLGIQKHAPYPPRSLTASLGSEVEKYDQLCDAIESHLLRAISVLQRDVACEQQRIADAKTASISTRTRSKSTSGSPTSTRMPLPPVPASSGSASGPESSPELPSTGTQTPPTTSPTTSVPQGRRPSAISLSSLQRPPFPHKLDLSSTALRISTEEAALFQSGLASPVTLAPKSARPTSTSEYPPDLMAAFEVDPSNRPVDIDLTLPDTEMASDGNNNNINSSEDTNMNLGNSADKPIELDLEGMDIDMANMTDLFGDSTDENSNEATAGLFSPPTSASASNTVKGNTSLSMELLDALAGAGNDDLFASFEPAASQNMQPTDLSQSSPSQHLTVPSPSNGLTSNPTASTSPGSILASFTSSNLEQPTSSSNNMHSGDVPFDFQSLDLDHLSPGFFTNAQGSEMDLKEMEALLNMGDDTETKPSS